MQYLLHIITSIFTPIILQKELIRDNLFITRIRNLNTLLILTNYFPPQLRNNNNCWWILKLSKFRYLFVTYTQVGWFVSYFTHTAEQSTCANQFIFSVHFETWENKQFPRLPFSPVMFFLSERLTVWTLKWNYAPQEM